MASWGDYIQLQLLSTGHVNQAMIINRNDGTTWATTPEFHLRKYTAPISVEVYHNRKIFIIFYRN